MSAVVPGARPVRTDQSAALRRGADVERVLWWLTEAPLEPMLAQAAALRDQAHERIVTFSPKVFLPLTRLCRDRCGYCTFAQPPVPGQRAYMTVDEVLEIARQGVALGAHEALFTLGDRPEKRYPECRRELAEMGFDSTVDYLAHVCRAVLDQTGLLPHTNPGVVTRSEMATLRTVSVSQGLMVESSSERLLEPGEAHHQAPDKDPALRFGVILTAGEMDVPFTSGLLVGIGETLAERAQTIVALAECRGPQVQELIIQNFRAKPGTRMENAPEPTLEEMLRAIAATRLLMGAEVNLQAPPNLMPGEYGRYLDAGINDWGGVSPLTPDHVNPERPWPGLDLLAQTTRGRGFQLLQRTALYPSYCATAEARARWLDPGLAPALLRHIDAEGYARVGSWAAGALTPVPDEWRGWRGVPPRREVLRALAVAEAGDELTEDDLVALFRARGPELDSLVELADGVRREVVGDQVTYAVVRNINYTNICTYHCTFCGFSKGKTAENLRGPAYLLTVAEVVGRAVEARERGATEVCLQGGIHPDFDGDFYVGICQAIRQAAPELHIHAFSPLEVWHGAQTLGLDVPAYLERLREAGLSTLPGTAAEILDDGVRQVLCPDKINTEQWVHVIESAHRAGLRTTSTIMYGSVEGPEAWARHLVVLRDLQKRTRGITEFVPLPFVHMEAPIFLHGQARPGPTWDESLKMHAVARLAFRGWIDNIQASWVKLGLEGALRALDAGANDLGGTLMNESISRSSGAAHGQELTAARMVAGVAGIGRVATQRDTLYRPVRPASAAGPLAVH
ncbi:MAG: 5-amino-6-(D-ribitylamino)uracil--L-tyrosine 4-hydroxyphenyl transferase CofH [Candidatus Dormibacteria bacterium]